MAQRSPTPKINSRTARNRLAARSAPYWLGLPGGWAIGFRKRDATDLKWLCRVPIGNKKYEWHVIGKTDDDEPSDGEQFLNFEQAVEAGRTWVAARAERVAKVEQEPMGERPLLVSDAIDSYLVWYATQRKALGTAKSHLNVLFAPRFGSRDITSLTVKELRVWLDERSRAGRMIRTRKLTLPGAPRQFHAAPVTDEENRQRRSTANRVLNTVKAMLNRSVDEWDEQLHGAAPLARPWNSVQSFPEADAARQRHLSTDEARRLVAACGQPFDEIVRAALLTGARYGSLCNFLVKDYAAGKLHVLRSKGGSEYWISLSSEGRDFFRQKTHGRHGDETIFLRADGEPWGQCHQSRPMDEACRIAEIDRCTFHELRHTYASRMLMNDPPIPMQVLAANLGHKDTRMVEKHYGHLLRSYHDDMIEKSNPPFGFDASSNVVPLKRS